MTPKGTGQIRFKCPNCQKGLLVKDQLAGKRVACPNCKKPLVVPVPRPASAKARGVDVEDLASSLLAEAGAAEQKAQAVPKIEMVCPYCEAELQFDESLAGKQEPCPKCRNILKIPQLKDGRHRDWRENTRTGPQFAKDNIEKKLDGAWEADRARVSAEALREADALPTATAEPVTVGRWIRRGAIGVAVVVVPVALYFGFTNWLSDSRQQQSVAEAESAFEKAKDKMPRVWKAEYQRALGEYFSHSEEAEKAQRKLQAAYATFLPAGKNLAPEEELLLIDVALTQVNLGGTEEQMKDKKFIAWSTIQIDLARTFTVIPSTYGQLFGLRRVSLKLLAKGQGSTALGLARTHAGTDAKGANDNPMMAEYLALLLALKEDDLARKSRPLPPESEAMPSLAIRLGYAEGNAYQGHFPEARKIAQQKGGLALDRLVALLAVADIGLHTDNSPEARTTLDEALKVAEGEMKKKGIPPLVMYQIAWLADRLGSPDQAQAWAGAITDSGCRMMAQFEILKQRSQSDLGALDPQTISDKKSLAFARALEYHARRKPTEALASLPAADLTWQPLIQGGLLLSGHAEK